VILEATGADVTGSSVTGATGAMGDKGDKVTGAAVLME